MRLPIRPPDDPLAALEGLGPGEFAKALDWLEQATASGAADPGYRSWDEIRRRSPPAGLTREQWWAALKLARRSGYRRVPLQDVHGRPFRYGVPDEVAARLQSLDSLLTGQIVLSEVVTDPADRDRYIVSSLIEEAITSSQLEGASTTYRVAKQMLRSGRKPRTFGERMIFNNYEAMRLVRELRSEPMTRETLLRLQEILTRDAIEVEGGSGRFRVPSDTVHVADLESGEVVHVPPPAEELDGRIESMLAWANLPGEGGKEPWTHPIVRSVLLHFWLAYDHPFVDGNGRTARILFYWSMLRRGYWMCEFLSLSRVLKRAPAAYARAFLHSELDENDATYFVLHQLECLATATNDLVGHVRRRQGEIRRVESALKRAGDLNHRQLALLSHALRHPDATYTIDSHARSQGVVRATARTDLMALEKRGFLRSGRVQRRLVFRPVQAKLGALSERSRRGAGTD